jgi:hypothetical protein
MPVLLVALLSAAAMSPEERAVAFLAREVPAWSVTNKCYSCHNNGNAARALYAAVRLGYAMPDKALKDTTRWLANPASWETNGGDETFNDKQLARYQFTLALSDAMDADQIQDPRSLREAAAAIIARQLSDGSWAAGPDGTAGSPTTLGSVLVTAEVRRLLAHVEANRYRDAVRRADDWIRQKSVKSVIDAASVLLALEKSTDADAMFQRKVCLAAIRKGESKDGGWGPYINSAPEVFDTALVVLALSKQPETEEIRAWLRRGRAYLLSVQAKDGSWPETTRPPGEQSYAERISTAGWATRALLATR